MNDDNNPIAVILNERVVSGHPSGDRMRFGKCQIVIIRCSGKERTQSCMVESIVSVVLTVLWLILGRDLI
uniref:Uncharacterized protein n=1 Tax=Onchocerca volvulus TaxID=6282 RepID=A0A8R1Y424_ONCVO